MNQRFTPTVMTYQDSDRRLIARVPLSRRDDYAELLYSDYERILAAGFDSPWHLNSNGHGRLYVRTMVRGGNETMIARLIANAPPRHRIRYADDNPLNLRAENLLIDEGWAKQDSAGMMNPAEPWE
jgi:hypothetical protein